MNNRRYFDNRINVVAATTWQQVQDALSVRSASYSADKNLKASMLRDGNDYVGTHFVAYMGEEPIGSARVRWFSGFAKFERSCLLPEYRNVRSIYTIADQVFRHVQMKGYKKVITVASEKFAKIWVKILGFKINEEKPAMKYDVTDELYYELIKTIPIDESSISAETESKILERIEGKWGEPGPYELSVD